MSAEKSTIEIIIAMHHEAAEMCRGGHQQCATPQENPEKATSLPAPTIPFGYQGNSDRHDTRSCSKPTV